jgi:hypothetical protein
MNSIKNFQGIISCYALSMHTTNNPSQSCRNSFSNVRYSAMVFNIKMKNKSLFVHSEWSTWNGVWLTSHMLFCNILQNQVECSGWIRGYCILGEWATSIKDKTKFHDWSLCGLLFLARSIQVYRICNCCNCHVLETRIYCTAGPCVCQLTSLTSLT